MPYKRITATFIDEITADIPAQNWGPDEWAREFDTYVDAGIDTVVMIRAGGGRHLTFPSEAVATRVQTHPVYVDLPRLFLDLAAERNIKFYFPLYDSFRFWSRYDWRTEVDINLALIDEILDKYADAPAFAGWYLTHETSDSRQRIIDINETLAKRIRESSPLPIFASPYFVVGRPDPVPGRGDLDLPGGPRTPEEFVRVWEEIFERYEGLVDQCAFQDGSADPFLLGEILAAARELTDRHGIELWSNLETFDRDMPFQFPPEDWRKLAHRLDAVQDHVEKIITFEFSHFLSPNSMWTSARHGYARYREFVERREQGER